MSELCKSHKLVLSPDGKCVLCKRPAAPTFVVREETEALISKVFTWLLGGCLVVALAALIYVSKLDPGYTGGRYQSAPGLGRADGSGTRAAKNPDLDSADEPRSTDAPADRKSDASKPTPETQLRSTAPRSAKVTRESAQPSLAAQADLTKVASLEPVPVTMYSAPWCYICDRARDFLLARNVALTDVNIERDRAGEKRLSKLNPTLSLPTFEIAGRTHIGFNPWEMQDAIRDAAQQSFSARIP